MKTVEALMSMPTILSMAIGANIVAGSEAAVDIGTTGAHAAEAMHPVMGLGILGVLLLSGVLLVAREMREETKDRRDRSKL